MLAEAFAIEADEAQRLVDALLEDGGTRRFSVQLAGPGDAAALVSLQVAAGVFLEAFGNTPELLRSEYAALLPAMTHLLVLDRTTRTAVTNSAPPSLQVSPTPAPPPRPACI